MLRLITISVNGGDYTSTETKPSVEQWQAYVKRQYRGITCYWQVRIIDAADRVVMYGFRDGFNGTGRNWVWRNGT